MCRYSMQFTQLIRPKAKLREFVPTTCRRVEQTSCNNETLAPRPHSEEHKALAQGHLSYCCVRQHDKCVKKNDRQCPAFAMCHIAKSKKFTTEQDRSKQGNSPLKQSRNYLVCFTIELHKNYEEIKKCEILSCQSVKPRSGKFLYSPICMEKCKTSRHLIAQKAIIGSAMSNCRLKRRYILGRLQKCNNGTIGYIFSRVNELLQFLRRLVSGDMVVNCKLSSTRDLKLRLPPPSVKTL